MLANLSEGLYLPFSYIKSFKFLNLFKFSLLKYLVPPDVFVEIPSILNLLVLGSRKLGKEINTPLIRKVSGKIFNLIERKVLNLKYKDIHCGFKYIASDQIMDIISSLDSMEFLYDLDLLLACRHKGFEIIENPVTYNFDRNSSVSLLRDPFKMLRDLFILKEKYNLNSFI